MKVIPIDVAVGMQELIVYIDGKSSQNGATIAVR